MAQTGLSDPLSSRRPPGRAEEAGAAPRAECPGAPSERRPEGGGARTATAAPRPPPEIAGLPPRGAIIGSPVLCGALALMTEVLP